MASLPVSNWKEKDNFVRVFSLVIEVASYFLQELLTQEMYKAGFRNIDELLADKSNKKIIKDLWLRSKIIHKQQYDQLYPKKPIQLEEFDITLITFVLSNCINLDQNLKTAVDDIREMRNKYSHTPRKLSIPESEFESRWKEYSSKLLTYSKILVDLRCQQSIKDQIDSISKRTISPSELTRKLTEMEDNLANINCQLLKINMDELQRMEELNEIYKYSTNQRVHCAIATTKATIQEETTHTPFISTCSFHEAKKRLFKNRIVVIKGQSGDGKTSLAFQLLSWIGKMDLLLHDGGDHHDTGEVEHMKTPIQVYNFKEWGDLIAPKMKLAILFDDVFGKLCSLKSDLKEFKERECSIKASVTNGDSCDSNVLILTVRNDVFKSLDIHHCDLFKEDNIIDLSREYAMNAQEKLAVLHAHSREHIFTDTEENSILSFAPPLGFPQCCHLYHTLPNLHKQRTAFFQSPFVFMTQTLEQLENTKISALLFLFLSGGRLAVDGLDPFGDTVVDEYLLKMAFEVHLFKVQPDENRESSIYRIQSLRDSLNYLSDSLVKKDNGYYIFCHDSICDAVALLFGEKFPTGFIKYCPVDCLRYLATSHEVTNKVVIEPNNKYLFMRTHEECKTGDSFSLVANLDIWNDSGVVTSFFAWLNDRNIEMDFMYEHIMMELNLKHSQNFKFVSNLNFWSYSGFTSEFFKWLKFQKIDNDFHYHLYINSERTLYLQNQT